MKVLWIYLGLINLITFLIYRADKQRARQHRSRFSEKSLLLWALFGGSAGAYLGMRIFHHKTNKPKFYLGVPLIMMVQIILALVCYKIFAN